MKETAEQKRERERWESEEDVRTLQRAEEIKASPKRMERARKYMKKVNSVLSKG